MRVLVPFDSRRPKTRLSGVLDADERVAFAGAMLRDVLAALDGADARTDPEILATAPVEVDVPTTVDRRSLSTAVNDRLDGETAVVMADLALLTPDAVDRLLGREGEVVLAPGRGGGTNAVVARHPDFRVDYHGVSYRDHLDAADRVGAEVRTVDSYRLSTDVDDPGDLPEVLLHGGQRSRTWLREQGFRIRDVEGRVRAVREE